MADHRLRLNDEQLTFLLLRLSELESTDEQQLTSYYRLKEKAKRECNKAEFSKSSNSYWAIKKKIQATKDMVRCFNSIVEGGRPRTRFVGRFACFSIVNANEEKKV